MTMSIILDGYKLEWDPAKGPAPPVQLRNLASVKTDEGFVTRSVEAGVLSGIIQECPKEELICILPLGIALNRVGKQRLVWDARHVNDHLRITTMKMETLQREGRALFTGASHGGSCDLSSAYHHISMHPSAYPYLGFAWKGRFYRFIVLPFGLATAPRIFSLVMGHTARFLRYCGIRILAYLDDIIFAAFTAREALAAGQMLLCILPRFGWLVNPEKCVGCSVPTPIFTALGTVIDLTIQQFRLDAGRVQAILTAIAAIQGNPRLTSGRRLAKIKGSITAGWVSLGDSTRKRTRAMDENIGHDEGYASSNFRVRKRAWDAPRPLSEACDRELTWWSREIHNVNGQPIAPTSVWDGQRDGTIFSDASDVGAGAVILLEGPEQASSALTRALMAIAPPGLSKQAVMRQARRGLEFICRFPPAVRERSSTHREMWGLVAFILAVVTLLARGVHRVIMDNLGCVFILGGRVPPFAVGGKQWGEFVTGGSRDPELHRMATVLFDLQERHKFKLLVEWRPREQNVRADYLSHVAAMRHHHYTLRKPLFRRLDAMWGPHSVDRFATASCCQPLTEPFSGRFCSQYWHPDALWTDAFSLPWTDENNWVFPPVHRVADAVAHLRASRACGTVITIQATWAIWWEALRNGPNWADDVVEVVSLGDALDALKAVQPSERPLLEGRTLLAIRMDGRIPRRAVNARPSRKRAAP